MARRQSSAKRWIRFKKWIRKSGWRLIWYDPTKWGTAVEIVWGSFDRPPKDTEISDVYQVANELCDEVRIARGKGVPRYIFNWRKEPYKGYLHRKKLS